MYIVGIGQDCFTGRMSPRTFCSGKRSIRDAGHITSQALVITLIHLPLNSSRQISDGGVRWSTFV